MQSSSFEDDLLKVVGRARFAQISTSIKMNANQSILNQLLFKCILMATLINSISSWIVDFNNPIVHTQYGSIRGKIDERKTKFNRRPICTFLSIPYARPPVGSNRFLVSICDAAYSSGDMKCSDAICIMSVCNCA